MLSRFRWHFFVVFVGSYYSFIEDISFIQLCFRSLAYQQRTNIRERSKTISEVLRKIKVTILRSLCRTWHEFRNYARVWDFFNHLLRPKWEDLKFSSNLARTSRLALFIMRITLWQIYWPYVRLLFNSINIRQRTLCVSHGLVDSEARQW